MAKVAQWPNAKRDGIGAGLVDLDGAKQHCSDDCDADRASDALHSADDAACHAGIGPVNRGDDEIRIRSDE